MSYLPPGTQVANSDTCSHSPLAGWQAPLTDRGAHAFDYMVSKSSPTILQVVTTNQFVLT